MKNIASLKLVLAFGFILLLLSACSSVSGNNNGSAAHTLIVEPDDGRTAVTAAIGGARAFLGSENFSSTSLDKNRELGILLNESDILARLHSTFETDWPLCSFD